MGGPDINRYGLPENDDQEESGTGYVHIGATRERSRHARDSVLEPGAILECHMTAKPLQAIQGQLASPWPASVPF